MEAFRGKILWTANVLTINSMEFDYISNLGIISPEFLGYLNNRFKEKINIYSLGKGHWKVIQMYSWAQISGIY